MDSIAETESSGVGASGSARKQKHGLRAAWPHLKELRGRIISLASSASRKGISRSDSAAETACQIHRSILEPWQ